MIMTALIYHDSGIDNEPCAVKSTFGENLLSLKNELDTVIISTLQNQNWKSGDYLVEIFAEDDGVCVDGEDLAQCYCDLEAGAVTWKTTE